MQTESKPRNPYRVSLRDRAAEEGFENVLEYLETVGYDSVVPALCTEWCDVELDGRCPHGCPSPLLAAGLI
jgi:hypothetical protein